MTVHRLEIQDEHGASTVEFTVRCDAPGCDLELASPTEEEALNDAALAGFRFEPKGTRHVCLECQLGTSPAAVSFQAQQAAAGMSAQPAPTPEAPSDPSGWLN